jgi:hypothetical protein
MLPCLKFLTDEIIGNHLFHGAVVYGADADVHHAKVEGEKEDKAGKEGPESNNETRLLI